jgi:hypothetical protein
MTTRADRGLLAELDGHDVLAGRASRHGLTLLTRQRRSWPRRPASGPTGEPGERRPGSRLIAAGAILLFLLGLGLLAVSFAAQYQYVLHERHQHVASLIEAGALDVGLIIFSLLALGLARAGLSAKIERAAVIGCAIGSAVMNYAAADVTNPRSVLAYCMPPVFLAFVVDRVVRTIQRHVLGMDEARSPWSVLADSTRRITRLCLLSALYVLRFGVDRRNTCGGLKQAILNATPLPEIPPTAGDHGEDDAGRSWAETHCLIKIRRELGALCGHPLPCPDHPMRERRRRSDDGRGPTKTARFLELVKQRHGDFAGIDPAQVSPICTELAHQVGIDPGNARTVLRRAVLAALPAGEGDSK